MHAQKKQLPVDLTKVGEFLRNLDFGSAPDAVSVEFQDAKVVYLKQEGGYCGVVFSKEGERLGLAHYVSMFGRDAAWVTPPGVTNVLAQENFGERKTIDVDKYKSVLRRVLSTLVQAILDSEDTSEEEEDVASMIGAPPWMTFHKVREAGEEMSIEDIQVCIDVGIEAYLLEFCDAAGYSIAIDVKKFLRSRINPNYVQVEEGEWDEDSNRNARHVFLRSGAERLAKDNGYRFTRANRNPQT
jgi:hypothetical protein